ncbi:MAG: helix-turn-helix domain-containing protein [Bacteroidia bacterium]|nr:helix-turn-helix domain-containing protein [Bacteroidia bacterium]
MSSTCTFGEGIPNSPECIRHQQAIQDALYVLSGKWKLPILLALAQGHTRFGEIGKAVGAIAPKVLSQELKVLEQNGFLTRVVHDTFPVQVSYQPTAYSQTLHPVLEALSDWGTQHRARVMQQVL